MLVVMMKMLMIMVVTILLKKKINRYLGANQKDTWLLPLHHMKKGTNPADMVVLKLWCHAAWLFKLAAHQGPGKQVTGLHLEKSCVCAPCMWWSNLGWFDLFGCVHTSTKRILAVSQFRNVHVIFPIGIWNGHKAFYLLWRASKSSATELGPLVCTSRYVSGLWCIWLCCPLFCLWLLSGCVSRTNSIQFTCTNRCLTSWTECRTNWRSAQALLVIIIICCFEDISH